MTNFASFFLISNELRHITEVKLTHKKNLMYMYKENVVVC